MYGDTTKAYVVVGNLDWSLTAASCSDPLSLTILTTTPEHYE